MMVEVKLFATFREGRFKAKEIDVPSGYSVGDILGDLEIPADEVGILMVNGDDVALDRTLEANDVVAVFPAVGGG